MTDELFERPAEPDHRPRIKREPAHVRVGPCKHADTAAHAARPAPHPGPRCRSCHRLKKLSDKVRAAERELLAKFGITTAEYDALYEAQEGKCYVCRIATGRRKKLAVEHDHTLAAMHGHSPDRGCRYCITGLACGECNQKVLGRIGHNPNAYYRLGDLLADPPARRILAEMRNAESMG